VAFQPLTGRGSGGYSPGMPIDETVRLHRRLGLINEYAPDIAAEDPTVALMLASEHGEDEDLVGSLLQTGNFLAIEQQTAELRDLPDDYQRAYFANLPHKVQQAYREAGYAPPERRQDNGFWKVNLPDLPKVFGVDLPDLPEIGAGEGTIGALTAPVAMAVGGTMQLAGEALDFLGAMPRAITHTYRSGAYMLDRNIGFGWDNLSEAWDATNRGEMTFTQAAEEDARELVGDEKYEVLRMTVGGWSMEEIAERLFGHQPGSPEYSQSVLQIYEMQGDPNWGRAATRLQLGKFSPGRQVADLFFSPTNDIWSAYGFISAVIDGGIQLMDPLMLAAPVGPASRAVARTGRLGELAVAGRTRFSVQGRRGLRFGVRLDDVSSTAADIEDFRRLYHVSKEVGRVPFLGAVNLRNGQAVGRVGEEVGRFYRDETRWTDLVEALPEIGSSRHYMDVWHNAAKARGFRGLDEADGWFDFLKSTEGLKALGTTKLSGFGRQARTLPHITDMRRVKMVVKEYGDRSLRRLAEDPDEIAHLKRRVLDPADPLTLPDGVLDSINASLSRSDLVSVLLESNIPLTGLLRKGLRAGANTTLSLLEHAPRGKTVMLHGPSAVEEYERLVRAGALLGHLPRQAADYYVNMFAGRVDDLGRVAVNNQVRYQAARSFLADLGGVAGMAQDEIDRWVGAMFRYSIREGDTIALENSVEGLRVGLLPSLDQSDAIAIPSLKELMVGTTNRGFLHSIMGSTPVQFSDAMIGKYWKPAVLLRVGFIIRAYGEELLHFQFTNPLWVYPQTKITQWSLHGDVRGPLLRTSDRADSILNERFIEKMSGFDEAQLHAIMQGDKAAVAGRFEDWSEWMYTDLRKEDLLALRPAMWTLHGISRYMSRFGDTALAKRVTLLDNEVQWMAAWASGKIRPVLGMAPLAARRALVEAAEKHGWLDPDMVKSMQLAYSNPVFRRVFDQLDVSDAYKPDRLADQERLIASANVKIRNADGSLGAGDEIADWTAPHIYESTDPRAYQARFMRDERMTRDPTSMHMLRTVLSRGLDDVSAARFKPILSAARQTEVEDVVGSLREIRETLFAKVTKKQRESFFGALGNYTEMEYLASRWMGKGGTTGLLGRLLDEAAKDNAFRGALIGLRHGDPIHVADVATEMQRAAKEYLQRPDQIKNIRSMARAQVRKNGERVGRPVPEGLQPMYQPMVHIEDFERVIDLDMGEMAMVFQAALARNLSAAGIKNQRVFDDIVDAVVMAGPEDFDRLVAVAESAAGDFVPATLFGTTNADVAQAIADALQETLYETGGKGLIGSYHVASEDVRLAGKQGAERLRLAGKQKNWEGAHGFILDETYASSMRVVNPHLNTRMVRFRRADGTLDSIEKEIWDAWQDNADAMRIASGGIVGDPIFQGTHEAVGELVEAGYPAWIVQFHRADEVSPEMVDEAIAFLDDAIERLQQGGTINGWDEGLLAQYKHQWETVSFSDNALASRITEVENEIDSLNRALAELEESVGANRIDVLQRSRDSIEDDIRSIRNEINRDLTPLLDEHDRITEAIASYRTGSRVEVRGGFSRAGRGTPLGDGKDKAMRDWADSAVVELRGTAPSSSRTSLETLGGLTKDSRRVMLARNGTLRGQPLEESTKRSIKAAHDRGATFAVGDMPGVDDAFVEYLEEIGARYGVWHDGPAPRFDVPQAAAGPAPSHLLDRFDELDLRIEQVRQRPDLDSLIDEASYLDYQIASTSAVKDASAEYERLSGLYETLDRLREEGQHGLERVSQFKFIEEYVEDGASLVSALDDWAFDLADEMVAMYVGTESGRVLHEIVGPLIDGSYQMDDLLSVAPRELPASIGPTFTKPPELGPWDKMVRLGFDGVIGPAGQAIVRQARFTEEITRAYKSLKPLADARFLDRDLEQAVSAIFATANRSNRNLDEVFEAWKKLPESVKHPSADPANVNSVLFGPSYLDVTDPILTREITLIDGSKGRIISPDGTFDGASYGFLMDLRRRGEMPLPEHWLTGPEIAKVRDWYRMRKIYEEELAEMIVERSLADIIPFIDDRKFRSQAQEILGNFVPFQFAEEQFLKRWLRTFAHDPSTIYKGYLTMMGLRHSGVVKTDPLTGEEIFILPGSSQLTGALYSAWGSIFGDSPYLPIAAPLAGQVKYSLPGLDGAIPGIPQPGPLVGASLSGLANIFPELAPIDDAINQRGSGRPIQSYFIPSSVQRIWDFVTADKDQLASATIQAMAYLEANGMGLADDATPAEIEEYQDTVAEHARVLLLTRALYGFASPAPPKAISVDAPIQAELQSLMRSGIPPEEAMAVFFERHPDATAYSVFGTESESGAPLHTTRRAFEYLEANTELFDTFKMAAPWLLPPSESSDSYERKAYYNQIAMGLRRRRDPEEWYEEMKFAKAADVYFDRLDEFNMQKHLIPDQNVQGRKALQQEFDIWKQGYFQQNPLFAKMLRDPQKANRRQEILKEMRLLMADPTVPETVVIEPLRELIEEYDHFKRQYDALKNDRRGFVMDYRRDLKMKFAMWVDLFVYQNPAVRTFYQRVLLPELDLSLDITENISSPTEVSA
jgi:hypothetical protein